MIVYIIFAVLMVLLGLYIKENSIYAIDSKLSLNIRQKHINRTLVFAIFFFMTMLSGTRIAVGNDFWVYRDNFELILQSRVVSSEIGFNGIVRIVGWFFGYDNYMPVFFVFSAITAFFFVKALYDESVWFSASMFLLMTNGFFFSSLNTVRYYLAFAIALWALKFVVNDRHLAFFVTVLAAATIHKTILIVIPFYYLAKIKWKKHSIPFFVIIPLLALIFRNPIRKLAFIIYPFYEGSLYDDYSISYSNIMKAAAVLIFSLIYYKKAIKDNPVNKFYFNLNVGALILFSCFWFLPESTRLGYYLSASNIFLLPAIIKSIDDKRQKIFWTVLIGLAYFVFFILYLRTLYSVEIRVLPYRSWFFEA